VVVTVATEALAAAEEEGSEAEGVTVVVVEMGSGMVTAGEAGRNATSAKPLITEAPNHVL